ncbi:hypothetical protein HN51_048150 [Arachis hypogaea]|uniref:DUF674 family protein n=1 Tax=Arachis hypogaea TaxID=3818 RepID=A0A445AJT4_ARAHY|nr:uncharacterized protein DS421_12g373930 [Arachis hypogaea]RYR26693.1 hypothetical protein Ahy_B02g060984 [Arachis hypogaea]
MASKEHQTFTLRLLVDREKNRVVVAEATRDFVDTLFSFLTIPLGTIIRLVSENNHHDQQPELGCINNLYRSVENSSDEVFWNPICKQMLLRPRNPYESLCKKLKLNVDDTEPTRCFMCSTKCKSDNSFLLSTFAGASCPSCRKLMDREMKLLEDSGEVGVFLKGEAMYMVFDDLKVLQNFPGNLMKELVKLGYTDFKNLSEMTKVVSLKGMLELMKRALTSNSPLSDVFLASEESKPLYTFSPKVGGKPTQIKRTIKIFARKSLKKIVYAEAEEDFVDFLFSFLTTPIGSTMKLLDGNASLGCINNLYKSVKSFSSLWFKGNSNDLLLDPQVAPKFGLRTGLQLFSEQQDPIYYYGSNDAISRNPSLVKDACYTKLFEPRLSDSFKLGFVRRPSLFVVWDDLHVTPLANASSISLLQNINAPLDDLEEHVISIGKAEAINLLGASLTSKAALTEGLFSTS